MLVTNSEFKFSGSGVKAKRTSFTGGIVQAVYYGLSKMAELGKHLADRPMLSIELAYCVAQCMGEKYARAVQTAGMV